MQAAPRPSQEPIKDPAPKEPPQQDPPPKDPPVEEPPPEEEPHETQGFSCWPTRVARCTGVAEAFVMRRDGSRM